MIEDNGHEQLSRPDLEELWFTVELLRHRLHAATFVGLNATRRLILPVQRRKRTDSHCESATEHGHARLRQVLGIRPFSIRKSIQDHRRERPASAAAWAGIEDASTASRIAGQPVRHSVHSAPHYFS